MAAASDGPGARWRGLTRLGRGLAVVGAVAALAGWRFHWAELQVLSGTVGLLLLVGLLGMLLPRHADVALALAPHKTTVGGTAQARVSVTARLPLVNPVLHVPAGARPLSVRLPIIGTGHAHVESFDLPTERRGVVTVGPVVNVQSDLLGCFRRDVTWARADVLHVRPRTVALEPLAAGIVSDLEGVPSDRLSVSDLAFHALREYVPGDDLRHVHWRSSAKADQLLVRQYLETRRSHATVLLDDRTTSYAGRQEFELAVSVAASVALRAAMDDFEVSLGCGDHRTTTRDGERLLDLTCRFERGETGLPALALRSAVEVPSTSLVVLVTGGRDEAVADLRAAGASFASGARTVLVRADRAGESRVVETGAIMWVVVHELGHLPTLLRRAGP